MMMLGGAGTVLGLSWRFLIELVSETVWGKFLTSICSSRDHRDAVVILSTGNAGSLPTKDFSGIPAESIRDQSV